MSSVSLLATLEEKTRHNMGAGGSSSPCAANELRGEQFTHMEREGCSHYLSSPNP